MIMSWLFFFSLVPSVRRGFAILFPANCPRQANRLRISRIKRITWFNVVRNLVKSVRRKNRLPLTDGKVSCFLSFLVTGTNFNLNFNYCVRFCIAKWYAVVCGCGDVSLCACVWRCARGKSPLFPTILSRRCSNSVNRE